MVTCVLSGFAHACAVTVRSRLARDASVCRFDADSSTFLSRIDCGVTSTASSSRMNSSDSSSDSGRGGHERPEDRECRAVRHLDGADSGGRASLNFLWAWPVAGQAQGR
jgi:hypothetical protein